MKKEQKVKQLRVRCADKGLTIKEVVELSGFNYERLAHMNKTRPESLDLILDGIRSRMTPEQLKAKNPTAITEEVAKEIKRRGEKENASDLAKEYGCSKGTIYGIISGRRWKNI
ncbi:MAG: hypothetical protein ACRCVX_02175 [Shewanella sp.]